MPTIDGIAFDTVTYHGDNAHFSISGVLVAKRKIINGFDNTGYTERFRLFADIAQGAPLPTVYPSFDDLYNPIEPVISSTGITGPTGLGWSYDIAKKYAQRPIHTVTGPTGMTTTGATAVLASVTYTYVPFSIASGATGDKMWYPEVVWVQEKVETYVEGVIA